jgi:hypothetical protein
MKGRKGMAKTKHNNQNEIKKLETVMNEQNTGIYDNKRYEYLTTKLDSIIYEHQRQFEPLMQGDSYACYILAIKEYLMNANIDVDSRRELYAAVIAGELIAAFA